MEEGLLEKRRYSERPPREEYLYDEGKRGSPKMMSVGLHCRLAGRPGRALGLAKFLDYVQSHDKVWIARRVDIARHWHENFPA